VCENNMYGMGTAVERASAVSEIRQKADGFGMPNGRVEGMDVLEVRRAAEQALAQVREQGPFLLEVATYRFRGHSMGDPERYRTPDEIKKWQEDDPIGIFRRHLVEGKTAKAPELDALDASAEEEVEDAIRFAEESPEPGPELVFPDVQAQVR